ncbi:MAG: 23S rRNA (guanosine(2251)-2'-O)-methyltransferase RlmB [Ignavibacteria bacterium]|jgi:23S rRNA (guanosine2251-2'-O)-methyltransferase|nr:23S rRNA (guanosine(2251)-2'-O)-methyltransferase RlmB [Ignavibacteria bacterium]
MLVIGRNPILEGIKSNPKDFNKIILLKTVKPDAKLKEIARIADDNGIKIIMLNKYDFEKYFSTKNKRDGITQGVIGFIKDYEYSHLKELLQKTENIKAPLLLILDEITDPHNFGAIIRSAVCLGADGIIIPRHNSVEVNHTVIKTSSGAVNYIPIAVETNLNNVIKTLKQNAFTVIGADASASKITFGTDLNKPVCIIIGSEGKGIRKSLKENCDELIRIPMAGSFNSLNASVSASILLYEVFRQKNV